MPIRTLADLLADLDTRQRPDPPSKNRVITKFAAVSDIVGLSSDTQIVAMTTPPFHWHDAAGTTATSLIWGMSEWRA